MQNDSFDFETDEEDQYKSLPLPKDDPYAAKILDWFVLNGYHTFEREYEDHQPWLVCDSVRRLTGINKPLCEHDDHPVIYVDETYSYQLDHLVELATMTSSPCIWPFDLMEKLLAPLQDELQRSQSECNYEILPFEYDDSRCVWVFSRFNENDFAESRLDLKMREHFVLVDNVDALLS